MLLYENNRASTSEFPVSVFVEDTRLELESGKISRMRELPEREKTTVSYAPSITRFEESIDGICKISVSPSVEYEV